MHSHNCISVSGTTNQEIWKEVRYSLGQRFLDDPDYLPLMLGDIDKYNNWVSSNGYVPFDKWLYWFIKVGTDRYGNLPKNKVHDNKVGHCWAPCPYSTQSSDLRTKHLLGLSETDPIPTKVDHENSGVVYYMKSTVRGSVWGFECTYIGCTYFILNGKKYFYR
jgi:hypothetical protein